MTDWKPIDEACSRVLRWKNGKPFEGDRKEMWVEFNSYTTFNGNPYKTMLYGKLEEVANEQQQKLEAIRDLVEAYRVSGDHSLARAHITLFKIDEVLGDE